MRMIREQLPLSGWLKSLYISTCNHYRRVLPLEPWKKQRSSIHTHPDLHVFVFLAVNPYTMPFTIANFFTASLGSRNGQLQAKS